MQYIGLTAQAKEYVKMAISSLDILITKDADDNKIFGKAYEMPSEKDDELLFAYEVLHQQSEHSMVFTYLKLVFVNKQNGMRTERYGSDGAFRWIIDPRLGDGNYNQETGCYCFKNGW